MDTMFGFVFGIIAFLAPSLAVITPSEQFPHKAVLQDNERYVIYWKHDLGSITFELHVKTKGWIGFGFSRTGRMTGSDIFIGYVTPLAFIYWDTMANTRSRPVIDDCQDWVTLEWKETDEHTVMKIWRPILTHDDRDINITSGEMNVVFAYGRDEPSNLGPNITYHGGSRGSMQIELLLPIPTQEPIPTTMELYQMVKNLISDNSRITQENVQILDQNEDLMDKNTELLQTIRSLNSTVFCMEQKTVNLGAPCIRVNGKR